MKRYDTTNASFVSDLTDINKKNQPKLILKDFTVNPDFNIDDIIKPKQTIKISKEDFNEFFRISPRYIRPALRTNQLDEYYNKYETLDEFLKEENIKLDDGYNMVEYHGSYNFIFIAGNFIYFYKKYNPDYVSINLYNIANKDIPELFKKYSVEEPKEIPHLNYIKDLDSLNIKYSMCSESVYNIVNCQDVIVPCLYTNLPYEYYSQIEDLDYLAYYDFQKDEFYFTGTSYDSLKELMKDIATNGIYNPLYLKINNGNIVCTLESHDKLIVAKMLRLPYIPVCLYLVPLQTAPYELLFNKKNIDKELINSICAPYFSF